MRIALFLLSLLLAGCPIDTTGNVGADKRPGDKAKLGPSEVDCRFCGDLNRPCCPQGECQLVYDQPLNGKQCFEPLRCLPDSEVPLGVCAH